MNAFKYPYPTSTPRYSNGGSSVLPQGFWASAGGAFTQTPQANQTTASNLNDLTAGDSQYIQQARNGAAISAAARGLGNSSYASGNAQGAAIRAAAPIAQADASMFATAALHNQDALNQTQMADRQNSTSITNANTAAGASMYGSDVQRYGINQQGVRQDAQNRFDAGQNDVNHQFAQSMLGLQNYYGAQDWARNLYGNILSGAYSTMYSNPDYFNDPNAAMGFINGFGNFASNQIDQHLYGDSP